MRRPHFGHMKQQMQVRMFGNFAGCIGQSTHQAHTLEAVKADPVKVMTDISNAKSPLDKQITELSGRLSDLNKGLASVKTLGGRIGFALFGAAESFASCRIFGGRQN